jgi:glycerol-3-phosphate dehydrogenase (NAD+)
LSSLLTHHSPTTTPPPPIRRGSVIARIVGENVRRLPHLFDPSVRLYAHEEEVDVPPPLRPLLPDPMAIRAPLTVVINNTHVNVKYLPNHTLPSNVIAVPSLKEAVHGCALLVFVLPHQFLTTAVIAAARDGVVESGIPLDEVAAISLIKGMSGELVEAPPQAASEQQPPQVGTGRHHRHGRRPRLALALVSDLIREGLGDGVPVSVLMGANVASEVADGQFCEATIGFEGGDDDGEEWGPLSSPTTTSSPSPPALSPRPAVPRAQAAAERGPLSSPTTTSSPSPPALSPRPAVPRAQAAAELFRSLFETPSFRIGLSPDFRAVELCGALKNVVALGVGFCDGLGFGTNTKAAIIRLGLVEMVRFIRAFYPSTTRLSTFFESCGVADLITTSFGGRNRRCAEAFVRSGLGWEEIEARELGGQKLQGTSTCLALAAVLEAEGQADGEGDGAWAARFPLFSVIHRIMRRELPPEALVQLYERAGGKGRGRGGGGEG